MAVEHHLNGLAAELLLEPSSFGNWRKGLRGCLPGHRGTPCPRPSLSTCTVRQTVSTSNFPAGSKSDKNRNRRVHATVSAKEIQASNTLRPSSGRANCVKQLIAWSRSGATWWLSPRPRPRDEARLLFGRDSVTSKRPIPERCISLEKAARVCRKTKALNIPLHRVNIVEGRLAFCRPFPRRWLGVVPWSELAEERRGKHGARSQLNGAHLTGSFLLVTAAAFVSGSPLFGVFVFAALSLTGLTAADIRPTPRGRRH